METIELKNNFHQLIDSINIDHLLSKFYVVMAKMKERFDGKLLARLSIEGHEEQIRADIDSIDPVNGFSL